MFKVPGQIYHGSYVVQNNKTIALFFGRKTTGEKCVWQLTSTPYFYVGEGQQKIFEYKDRVAKINCSTPAQVGALREKYPIKYEADVPFARRVLLDNLISEEYVPPKVVYYDIESDRNGAIISLSAYFSDKEEPLYLDRKNIIVKDFFSAIKGYDIITSWSDYDIKQITKYDKLPMDILYLDLLDLFRKVYKLPIKNHKLSTVATLVDLNKIEIPVHPEDLSEEDLKEYNLRDAEILKKLDNKFKIIEYFTYLASQLKCFVPDTITSSKLNDCLVLRESNKKGLVLRNKEEFLKEEYEGAYVYVDPGLYQNVDIYDFSGMYPSCIIGANISFDTIDENGEIKVPGSEFRFKKKPVGVIPSILKDAIKTRQYFKQLYKETGDESYNILQEAMKGSVINSMYGFLAYNASRVYDVRVASAITSMARSLITFMKDRLEKSRARVILVDTDSLYLTNVPSNIQNIIDKSIEDFKSKVGLEYDFNLEFKGSYEKAFIAKKKNYVLYNPPDQYTIKGMGIIRGDTSSFQKDLEFDIIRGIIDGKSKKELFKMATDKTKKMRDYDLEYIAFPKKVNNFKNYKVKTLASRAVEYTKKYIGDVDDEFGFLCVYVRRTPSGLPDTDVIALPKDLNKIKGFEIDYDKMSEKSLQRVKEYITPAISDFFN